MSAPSKNLIHLKLSDIIVPKESTRKDLGDVVGLAKSIKKNGLINPIVIDKAHNLIDGMRRLEALKILKSEVVDCRFYEELSEYQKRRIQIETSLHTKKLSWQEETKLREELHDLYAEEAKNDPELLEKVAPAPVGVAQKGKGKKKGKKGEGWTQQDTAKVLSVSKATISQDLQLAKCLRHYPQLKNIKSKRDAIRKMYRIRHYAILEELARRRAAEGKDSDTAQLIHGDAFEEIKKLGDESVDLVITDPPWGISLARRRGPKSSDQHVFKDKIESIGVYEKIMPELFRVMRPGSHLWIFFGMEHQNKIHDTLAAAGFDVRTVPCVWIKENSTFTNWEQKPMPQYEGLFFAVKTVKGYAKMLSEATSDVFEYKRTAAQEKLHPTEKPVEFMKRLIHLSSVKDDLVLDPFAGSASVLVAATLSQRRSLGFEKDKQYYELAFSRLSQYIFGSDATLEDDEAS